MDKNTISAVMDSLQQRLAENEAHGKHIRAYADACKDACAIMERSWTKYCQRMKPSEDSHELLATQTQRS